MTNFSNLVGKCLWGEFVSNSEFKTFIPIDVFVQRYDPESGKIFATSKDAFGEAEINLQLDATKKENFRGNKVYTSLRDQDLIIPETIIEGSLVSGRGELVLKGTYFSSLSQDIQGAWQLLDSPLNIVSMGWLDPRGYSLVEEYLVGQNMGD